MLIALSAELKATLTEVARQRGMTREAVAIEALTERFLPPTKAVIEPRDEWERRLLSIATDCGVSLSNEALSREELYD